MGGFLETAKVLLEVNADFEAKAEGATPVQITYYEDQIEMVRFLLKAGAKTDFRKGWRLREDFPDSRENPVTKVGKREMALIPPMLFCLANTIRQRV